MKVLALITIFLVHSTTATIDVQKLKDVAEAKIQKITDFTTLAFQQFADTIDIDKVKQLDILNVLPKIQYKGKVLKETYEKVPEYKKKVKFYLQSLKSLSGKDFVLAFDGSVD